MPGRHERTYADMAAQKGLGLAVQQVRSDKDLTPADLAAQASLSITTIRSIERGLQDTTWGNLRRLAEGLGVGLDQLLDLAIDLAPGRGGNELRRARVQATSRQE